MLNIVQVEPIVKCFSVTWMLGARCNYDCMYCPVELHDHTSKHHSIDTLKQSWQQVVEKTQHLALPYKLSFTGGEVTTNRDFLPFLEWLKQQSYEIQLFTTTNGSASLKYYSKLAQLLNGLTMSTHSEFMDEAKFFKIASALNPIMQRPEKSLHVNIMDEHWNQDRISHYVEYCQRHDISHSVNTIDYSQQTRITVYNRGKRNILDV